MANHSIDKVKKNSLTKTIFGVLSLLLLLLISLTLLTDNSAYPFALFVDEWITYAPIHKAIHGSLWDALAFFFDGKDMRYGRILWNLNFVLSYLPSRIFGDQTQIVLTRTVQTGLLLGGYYLLASALIRNKLLQVSAFVSMLLLQASFYYMLMPKPEPEIVFCLGLLFQVYKKRNFKAYYILCGLLAGLKLSMLPMAGILIITGLFNENKFDLKILLKELWPDIKAYLKLGNIVQVLFIAVLLFPLLNSYITNYCADNIYERLKPKSIAKIPIYPVFIGLNALMSALILHLVWYTKSIQFNSRGTAFKTLSLMLTGFGICNPFVFFTPYNIAVYLSTPVTHGIDNEKVNAVDWLSFIYKYIFFEQALSVIVFGLTLIIGLYLLRHQLKSLKWSSLQSPAAICILGFFINITPIVFFTKRLWGFYLLIPFVFFLLCLYILIDRVNTSKPKLGLMLMVLPFAVFAYLSGQTLSSHIRENKAKSKTLEFSRKVNEYYNFCDSINLVVKNRPDYKVFWDPNLFFPDNVKGGDLKVFWGPFNAWHENRDMIVLSGYPDSIYQLPLHAKNRASSELARQNFEVYTDRDSGTYKELFKDRFRSYKVFVRK